MQPTENNKNSINGKKDKAGPIVNVAKLDAETPIPLDYGSYPFTVASGQRYLPFLSNSDIYPNLMWEARVNSVTQNACITSIAQTCVGKGLMVMNVDEKSVDPEFITFISKINDEETLADLIRTAIECRETDGNAWVEIVKGSVGSKKYLKAYVHSSLICRFAAIADDKDKPDAIVKSVRFAGQRQNILSSRQLKGVTLPLYCDNPLDQKKVWSTDGNKDLHTIIHLKNNYKGSIYYGMQRSVASFRYQLLEGKSAQYNIDNFDNNMVLSAIMTMKSAMTQAEAQAAAQEIIKTHTGAGKQGRIAVISSESGIEDFDITPMSTQKEGSYDILDSRVEQKIISSNAWDGIFFGIRDKATLARGNSYVRAIYDVKKATTIDPINTYMISHLIKPLIAIAAEHLGKPEWTKYELEFDSAMPFSYSSDIDINSIVTKNEGRAMLGFAKGPDPAWETEAIKSGGPAVSPSTQTDNVPTESVS